MNHSYRPTNGLPNNLTLPILKERLQLDYQLYYFVKQRTKKALQKIDAKRMKKIH